MIQATRETFGKKSRDMLLGYILTDVGWIDMSRVGRRRVSPSRKP
jgi:hypothetical protein